MGLQTSGTPHNGFLLVSLGRVPSKKGAIFGYPQTKSHLFRFQGAKATVRVPDLSQRSLEPQATPRPLSPTGARISPPGGNLFFFAHRPKGASAFRFFGGGGKLGKNVRLKPEAPFVGRDSGLLLFGDSFERIVSEWLPMCRREMLGPKRGSVGRSRSEVG